MVVLDFIPRIEPAFFKIPITASHPWQPGYQAGYQASLKVLFINIGKSKSHLWDPKSSKKSTEHSMVVYLGISVCFLVNVPEF